MPASIRPAARIGFPLTWESPTDSIQHHPALENRLAGHQAKHKENDKHNDENSEKYTRDPAGGRRYAGESKDTGGNGYHEKEEC
jgi:hypothetical protein